MDVFFVNTSALFICFQWLLLHKGSGFQWYRTYERGYETFMLRRSSLVECVSVLHGTCLQCVKFFFYPSLSVIQYVQLCLSKNPKYTLYTIKRSHINFRWNCSTLKFNLILPNFEIKLGIPNIKLVCKFEINWSTNKNLRALTTYLGRTDGISKKCSFHIALSYIYRE